MRKFMMTCALVLTALALPACTASSDTTPEELVVEETAQTQQALRSTVRLDELAKLSLEDLGKLYAKGTTEGGMPTGVGVGRAFFLGVPGAGDLEKAIESHGWPTVRTGEDFIANLIWNGKTFRPVAPGDPTGKVGMLTNRVLGFDVATANIFHIAASADEDEANTYYLDYSKSDWAIVRSIQDYIRKVGDGLYVGKAFITLPGQTKRVFACYFALDFLG